MREEVGLIWVGNILVLFAKLHRQRTHTGTTLVVCWVLGEALPPPTVGKWQAHEG